MPVPLLRSWSASKVIRRGGQLACKLCKQLLHQPDRKVRQKPRHAEQASLFPTGCRRTFCTKSEQKLRTATPQSPSVTAPLTQGSQPLAVAGSSHVNYASSYCISPTGGCVGDLDSGTGKPVPYKVHSILDAATTFCRTRVTRQCSYFVGTFRSGHRRYAYP